MSRFAIARVHCTPFPPSTTALLLSIPAPVLSQRSGSSCQISPSSCISPRTDGARKPQPGGLALLTTGSLLVLRLLSLYPHPSPPQTTHNAPPAWVAQNFLRCAHGLAFLLFSSRLTRLTLSLRAYSLSPCGFSPCACREGLFCFSYERLYPGTQNTPPTVYSDSPHASPRRLQTSPFLPL